MSFRCMHSRPAFGSPAAAAARARRGGGSCRGLPAPPRKLPPPQQPLQPHCPCCRHPEAPWISRAAPLAEARIHGEVRTARTVIAAARCSIPKARSLLLAGAVYLDSGEVGDQRRSRELLEIQAATQEAKGGVYSVLQKGGSSNSASCKIMYFCSSSRTG